MMGKIDICLSLIGDDGGSDEVSMAPLFPFANHFKYLALL
jgi:hypothetical protein